MVKKVKSTAKAKAIKVNSAATLEAKYRSVLTVERFRKWLKKCGNQVVGVNGEGDACPLAKFAVFSGFTDASVGPSRHYLSQYRGFETSNVVGLPSARWASRFVTIVDSDMAKSEVTGNMGLKALELASGKQDVRLAVDDYIAYLNDLRDPVEDAA